MKIVVGIQKSKIETDNPKLLKALQKLYSFKVPGAAYTSAYRKRSWDGKKRFIGETGVFRSGLLIKILAHLKKIDCVPDIKFNPRKPKVPRIAKFSNIKYYDYQKELIGKALVLGRATITAPTGSGKTLIMAGLIKSLKGKKMVILFNTKQLLKQTYDFLKDVCDIDNLGLCFGEGYIYGDIMLSTVQSIEKILDTHLEEAEVLMVDECHEFCSGKTTLAAIEAFSKAAWRFGFTATVPSEPIKKYSLEGALGSVIKSVNTQELVEKGKLTRPIIKIIERDYEADGDDEQLSYLDVYDKYIVFNKERNEKIKELIKEILNGTESARILILTKSLDHGRALDDSFAGLQSEFLEGACSVGERYQSISRFRNHGEGSILIGTRILQTGINIEEITHFVNARGMKSEIATIQALGRALRVSDNKDEVYVYDFMDKEKYLYRHSRERIAHYKKEGHEVTII
jgi:superfamily II DNA or RNA helicase